MKIHEYQAKEILRAGMPVDDPKGRVDGTEQAAKVCEELGGRCSSRRRSAPADAARGAASKRSKSPEEARDGEGQILGMQLEITHQTGPEGQLVRKVLVEETADIAQELYVSITLDRAQGKPVVMASAQGGMDIEEVVAKDPNAIFRQTIEPELGLQPFQGRAIARALGLKGATASKAAKLIAGLVAAYMDTDASLAEINPLMVTGGGDVMALGKVNFDDNALYRHKDILDVRDLAERTRSSRGQQVQSQLHQARRQHRLHGQQRRARHGDDGHHQALRRRAGKNFLDVGGGASAGRRSRTPSASWSRTPTSRR